MHDWNFHLYSYFSQISIISIINSNAHVSLNYGGYLYSIMVSMFDFLHRKQLTILFEFFPPTEYFAQTFLIYEAFAAGPPKKTFPMLITLINETMEPTFFQRGDLTVRRDKKSHNINNKSNVNV